MKGVGWGVLRTLRAYVVRIDVVLYSSFYL